MQGKKLKSAVEAIVFACGTPVEIEGIARTLEISEDKVIELCSELSAEYAERQSGIRIVRLGKCFQMCSVEEYADAIRSVLDLRRNTPLSQAASEVLAVIAYNQPVTKAFIEQVRGVDCSGVVASLHLTSFRRCLKTRGRRITMVMRYDSIIHNSRYNSLYNIIDDMPYKIKDSI